MDDKVLQEDIQLAEELDETLREESDTIEDIQGSMEAIGTAIASTGVVQLTDHQQEMVDALKNTQASRKGAVYAVADKAALEAYVDSKGILRPFTAPARVTEQIDCPHSFFAEHGANVWGVFSYGGLILPGNEGFVEMTAALARKGAVAFSEAIPKRFTTTAKSIRHYVDLGQKLRTRLVELQALLKKRQFPYVDVFEYGAYSRFFQANGKAIGVFSEFKEAMDIQAAATTHVFRAAESYSVPVMEKLLESLQELQINKESDADKFIELKDNVANQWTNTWLHADITPKPGQTPQSALNAFPERKFTSLAPLLDNRYLVAHKPSTDSVRDPAKITAAIKHYGASVATDKKAGASAQTSMNIPNIDELEELVTQTLAVLNDMRGLEVLAKKNDTFAKDFKRAADILIKALPTSTDKEFFGFVSEYFKLATAVGDAIQQPYVQMAWMYIRCAMVVTSIVELAVLEDPKDQLVTKRFATKQNAEFTNVAMESFQITWKALEASRHAGTS